MNNSKTGATLLELMLATMLLAVVILASGMTMTSITRQQNLFSKTSDLQANLDLIEQAIRQEIFDSHMSQVSHTTNSITIQKGSKDVTSLYLESRIKDEGEIQLYDLVLQRNNLKMVLSDSINHFEVSSENNDITDVYTVRFIVYRADSKLPQLREIKAATSSSFSFANKRAENQKLNEMSKDYILRVLSGEE